MTLKEKLEKVLESKSQKELAKEIGVHFSTLKRVRGVVQGKISQKMIDYLEEKLNEYIDMDNVENETIQSECEPCNQEVSKESEINSFYTNDDVDFRYVNSLERKIQRLLDHNRILRKERREGFREDNITEDFFDEIKFQLKKRANIPHGEFTRVKRGNGTMIVHLSDLHLGQLVEMYDNNFSFDIAEERLFKFSDSIIEKAKREPIDKIIIAFTGDLFSLDHRMDMLLTSQYTRAENFVRGFDLLCAFVNSIVQTGLEVSCVGVVGNESRVKANEFHSNVDKIAKDNLDYMVFQMLKRAFSNVVNFMNECDCIEDSMIVNGLNILMCHGDKFKHTNDEITKLKMRHAENGNYVDHVILGHIHQFCLTPTWSRSGSLVGGNSYSSIGLNIPSSIASQNIYIVRDGLIEGTAIRLDK